MGQSQIKFYYKNADAEAIGAEHGIKQTQLEKLLGELKEGLSRLRSKPELKAKEDAYRRLPYDSRTVDKVNELVAKFRADCDNLVVLGIGGSALGNIALQTALNPFLYNLDDNQRKGPRLFVLDNVDPQQFGSFLDYISDKLDKTIFNVISKSGRTAETASQFLTVRKLLINKLGEGALKKHIVATTDSKTGTLRRIADDLSLQCLEVPNAVGGRFSVLSAVGLFSAAMCGIDIDSLLAGAADMDDRISSENFAKNPAAVNAAINYHFYKQGKRISVMMPYSSALYSLADWYRQLWAESLGKSKDLLGAQVYVGPTPVKALGATDQHSQVQLYREGPNDKLFTFLEVEDFGTSVEIGSSPKVAKELDFLAGKGMGMLLNSEKKATEYTLLSNNRPCLSVIFPQVSAYTVGQFIYMYEVTTTFTGALFGINPFDQPAVELGKQATFALMGKDGFCEYVNLSYTDFAKEIKSKTNIDAEFLL
jgi:glucose-6-phosphate isomerase